MGFVLVDPQVFFKKYGGLVWGQEKVPTPPGGGVTVDICLEGRLATYAPEEDGFASVLFSPLMTWGGRTV